MTEHEMSQITGADCLGPCCIDDYWAHAAAEYFASIDALDAAATALGCVLPSPYMALSFLGLAVVPELRLTDMGLVDVALSRLVPFGAD